MGFPRRFPFALAACVLAIATARVFAQADAYPERTVSIVVPYAPGGVTDVLTRIIGRELADKWGKPFVVENRPGAGTLLAAVAVSKAVPDGYTLLTTTSSTMAINPTLYKKLPYDPLADFRPVALIGSVPFVLVVNPSLPVRSTTDLIKLAKDSPGRLNYGSGGVGSGNALFAEMFKSMAGIDIAHVPYKGFAPALNDTIAGHIQLMFTDLAPARAMITEGKLRALAVSSKERVAVAPDIPPMAETGLPGYDAVSWQMVVAPADTPKDVIAKLNAEINAIVNSPEVSKQLAQLGMIPGGKSSPEELQQFVNSETARWGKVIRDAGIAGSQ